LSFVHSAPGQDFDLDVDFNNVEEIDYSTLALPSPLDNVPIDEEQFSFSFDDVEQIDYSECTDIPSQRLSTTGLEVAIRTTSTSEDLGGFVVPKSNLPLSDIIPVENAPKPTNGFLPHPSKT